MKPCSFQENGPSYQNTVLSLTFFGTNDKLAVLNSETISYFFMIGKTCNVLINSI